MGTCGGRVSDDVSPEALMDSRRGAINEAGSFHAHQHSRILFISKARKFSLHKSLAVNYCKLALHASLAVRMTRHPNLCA